MNNILRISPTPDRMFLWFAQYNNGEYFHEFETQFNEFDKIQKDALIRFGLTGMNMIMDYEVATGIFDICGRKISFMFKDKLGIVHTLTNTGLVYNDCISYKSAETIVIGRNQGHSYISGYHYGYKIKLGIFNVKIIVHLPMDGKVSMDISITSEQDLEGELQIIRNDELFVAQPISLIKNQTSNVNWIVV